MSATSNIRGLAILRLLASEYGSYELLVDELTFNLHEFDPVDSVLSEQVEILR